MIVTLHKVRVTALTTIALALSGVASQAQQPDRSVPLSVTQDPQCSKCRIELKRLVTISDEDFDISISGLWVSRDAGGRIYVGGNDGAIGVFDSNGKLLKRLGAIGSGPGEFRQPFQLMFGRGDSILVLDRNLRRVSIFDSSGNAMARSFQMLGSPTQIIPLENGHFIASGQNSAVGSIGLSLHQLDKSSGAVIRSASADPPARSRAAEGLLPRVLAHAPHRGFYAASVFTYRIEEWSEDFKLIRTLERDAKWFPPLQKEENEKGIGASNQRAQPAHITGIATDLTTKTIYATIRLGAANFKPDPKVAQKKEVSRADVPRGAERNRYVDTIIETIDLVSGKLLASHRIPGYYHFVERPKRTAREPLIWSIHSTPEGTENLEIATLQLVRR